MCSDLVLDADRLTTQGGRHEIAYDGSRPHRPFPACSEIFFDRLTALYAVGQAKNFWLLFASPLDRHPTWWLWCELKRQGALLCMNRHDNDA
jgi:hypothetical protein